MIIALGRYAAHVRQRRIIDFMLGVGMGGIVALALLGFFA